MRVGSTNVLKIVMTIRITTQRAARINSKESFTVSFSLSEVSETEHFVASPSAVMAAVGQLFSTVWVGLVRLNWQLRTPRLTRPIIRPYFG